jgi:hypothetical protein
VGADACASIVDQPVENLRRVPVDDHESDPKELFSRKTVGAKSEPPGLRADVDRHRAFVETQGGSLAVRGSMSCVSAQGTGARTFTTGC